MKIQYVLPVFLLGVLSACGTEVETPPAAPTPFEFSTESSYQECIAAKKKESDCQDAEYLKRAKLETSITRCDGIVNPQMKKVCQVEITSIQAGRANNFDMCGEFDKDDKDQCFLKAVNFRAQDMRDASICSQFSNEKLKNDCEDAVNMMNARMNQDINLCKSLHDDKLQATCDKEISDLIMPPSPVATENPQATTEQTASEAPIEPQEATSEERQTTEEAQGQVEREEVVEEATEEQ